MQLSCTVRNWLGKARDRLAAIAAAPGAQRVRNSRGRLGERRGRRSRTLTALLLSAAAFGALDAAGATVELQPQDPLDSLPGAAISTNTLRGAILEAHTFPPTTEVIIRLKPNETYRIRRPTVLDGQSTEGTANDPYHGDFDIARNLTIEGEGALIDAQHLGRIFDFRSPVRVTIRNVRLSGGGDGDTLGAGRLDGGGAVRISNSATVVFENVVFSNNRLEGLGYTDFERRGGAIYVADPGGGHVTLTDCHFEWNGVRSAGSGQGVAGGAIYHSAGILNITRTRFIRCWAMQDPGPGSNSRSARGGAIYVGSGDALIVASEFVENSARAADGVGWIGGQPAEGGAIYAGAGVGSFEVEGSVFQRNSAKSGRGADNSESVAAGAGLLRGGASSGGAVFLHSSREHFHSAFRRCEFEDNFAFAQAGGYNPVQAGAGGEARGGAIFVDGGPLELADTRFTGNAAVGGDGGFTSRTGGGPLAYPRGGSGGAARGGAVYANSAHGVYVTGTLKIEVSGSETNYSATTHFSANHALGGYGRPGRGNEESDGAGGDAAGGGIWLAGGRLELKNVLAQNNTAQGGGGANIPDQPRFSEDDGSDTNLVGRGGSNGDARGGFLHLGGGEALIEESEFAFNRATGGRFEARVILQVPPENNGEWSVSKPNAVAPFVAGSGGTGLLWPDYGAPGGDGGHAIGGAIYSAGRLVVRGSGIMANQAYGARGGSGGAARDLEDGRANGGDGGDGGYARGGGIAISSTGTFDIEGSLLIGNIAMAGTGGAGGKGGNNADSTIDSDCEDGCGGDGGAGGDGGGALGGALYSERFPSDPTQETRLVACFVAENKAVAGDGFFGGHGGTGGGFGGGSGGLGGDGGHARGGGVSAAALYAERVTIHQNVISSGWGGAGGHGGGGDILGGFASPGGSGGVASGGGVYLSGALPGASSSHLVLSTLSNNRVYAGRGGQGGFGGPAWVIGGNGAAGGTSGFARGGGLYVEGGSVPASLTDSTVAGNLLDAGDGGFAGIGGVPWSELDSWPVRYHAASPGNILIDGWLVPGPPIVDGAYSSIRDEWGFPMGTPPLQQGYQAPITLSGGATFSLHDMPVSDSISSTEEAIIAGASAGLAGAAGIPFSVGALGAFGVHLITHSTWAVGGATSWAIGGATAAALPVAGIGLAAVTSTLIVGTWVGHMIATDGDFEAAAIAMLGKPGDVSRYNLLTLMTAPDHEEDDDEYADPEPGRDGSGGAYRAPQGTGVYGYVSMTGTLVGDNRALRRRRPYQQKTIRGEIVREFTETTMQLGDVPDVAGAVTSEGGNFITIAPSGFTTSMHDIVGSADDPKAARVASDVAYHGGDVPTLKLLPGSPARGAIPAGFGSSQSQNGFSWSGTRDIGAWGAPPNRRPWVRDKVIRVTQGSGEVTFARLALLDGHTDPDGDDVRLTDDHIIATPMEAWTILTDLDPEVRTYWYTPPADFVGIKELYQFAVTDGELVSNLGKVILHVVPAESALECPPFGSGLAIPIASEPVGGSTVTARYVELPESARSDHNFTGPFTVEFWMRMDRDWVHQHEPLITKGDSAWRIQRGSDTDRLAFGISGLDPLSLYSNREINDRTWHHVAAVYDGAYKLLYIDGELDAWAAVAGTPAVNDEPVWIGGNSQYPGRRFRGHMDEVRIWNHARSATEIRENFTRRLTGYEDGLLTYYPFDEPSGSAVVNHALHGTMDPGFARAYQDGQTVWRSDLPVRRSQPPVDWTFGSRIVGRHLFYNESSFDGYDPAATEADDNAIAPTIRALLPGEQASEANRTAYSRGINGVIIDLAWPRDPNALSLDDFEFASGNSDDPDSWAAAEPPASILVRPGAGICGSTRVTLAWADLHADPSVPNRAVGNGWLRVTVRANETTGLHHDDVFYFGSSIGDSDDEDFIVSAADALRALNNITTAAGLADPYDFNRDGMVSAQDALVALNHTWTTFHLLNLRMGPYREADAPAASPALAGFSPHGENAPAPLRIGRATGDRIQLEIPPIATGHGEIAGVILTAPTPSGPWSLLPGGLVPRLAQDFVIEVTPDQEAAFFRLETDSTSR